MTTERDPRTRLVLSWLRDDAHENAERVLLRVLDEVDTTPQRRSWGPARRVFRVNTSMKFGIAAAAALLIAFAALRFLPASSVGPGRPTDTPVPTATPAPTEVRFRVGSGISSRVTVLVPAGWSTSGDWVLIGPNGNLAPTGMAIRFYKVAHVYKNPLDFTDGYLTVGPSVEQLASAIAAHPAWEATPPTDITLGGQQGKLVRMTIPSDKVLGSDGKFLMFGDATVADGDGIWGFAPGQVFDLHIVDAGGERIVIEAFHYTQTTAADLAAQQTVIDSIEIVPAGP